MNKEKLEILFATHNRSKVTEVQAFLRPFNIATTSLLDYPQIGEIEEDGDTFKANAFKKANEVVNILGCPVIADDSGLVVDALDGAPGVYSARYSSEHATAAENNFKLLSELLDVPAELRTARFRCVIAMLIPPGPLYKLVVGLYTNPKKEHLLLPFMEKTAEDRILLTFEGTCEGRILTHRRGTSGFGYDPLFYFPKLDMTFAELSMDAKNRISHRGRALGKLIALLRQVMINTRC